MFFSTKNNIYGLAGRSGYIDGLLACAVFIFVFLTYIPFAERCFINPDSCVYLDIGRNLFSGKGPVISYNLYQLWPGKYYPSLPYTPPLYPIFSGFIFILFGLKAVIGANIFLLSVNCAMLYRILRSQAGIFASFFIALFIGFSPLAFFTATWAFTAQLQIFFLLLAMRVYLRNKNNVFITGIILAMGSLVNMAGIYNVIAFAIAIAAIMGFNKSALRENIKFISGFLLVFLLYQVFCYIKYGAFCPQYLGASETWNFADSTPGAFYQNKYPVLVRPMTTMHINTVLSNVYAHFRIFSKCFPWYAKLIVLNIPAYLLFAARKRKANSLAIICALQGIVVILCYVAGFTHRITYGISRYAMIPYLTLLVAGFLSAKELYDNLIPVRIKAKLKMTLTLIAVSLALLQVRAHIYEGLVQENWSKELAEQRKDRYEIYAWVRKNSRADALIASNSLDDTVLLDRPFVSLPKGEVLTVKNMKDFIDIFNPEYVIVDYYRVDISERLESTVREMGLPEIMRSGNVILFSSMKGERHASIFR